MMRARLIAAAAGAISSAAMGGCASAAAETSPQVSLEQLGEKLFTEETFDGNGRVCSTCHELDQFGTITPEFVQNLYETNPEAPLFRAIDSDDGLGRSYERLKKHATIRVPIELPARTASGLGVRKCGDPANTSVVVHRGNPTVFNMAPEQHIMHDGREGDDLEKQALNAVFTHSEPGHDPTPEELAAITAFQESLFSHEAVKEMPRLPPPQLTLPDGNTSSEKRGRGFFGPDRQCGQCHSGPMLNRTSEFHPNAVGFAFESVFVGREPDNPNQKFMWCYVDLATNEIVPGPFDAPEVFSYPVSDPGLGLIAGITEFRTPDGTVQFIANEILVHLAGPTFKIPTLWGTPNTAPYFHDNSAKDLDEVLDQYNFFFSFFPDAEFGLGCDRDRPECLSEEDKIDIINFMQLLSFQEAPPPQPRP